MSLLDTYIKEMYSDLSGADNVLDVIGTVNPFSLASSVFTSPFAGKPDPVVGSADSKGKFYAGENFGYQTPDSYRDIFKAFPKAYVDLQKAKQEAEKKKEQESLPDVGDFRSPDNKYFTNDV